MRIKKLYIFILFIAVFMLVYSCSSRFNPKYYYNKNLISDNNSDGGNLPDDFVPDDNNGDTNNGGNTDDNSTNKDGVYTNTIYLDPFKNGEWNDPNYRFSMNFDDYLIQATFSGDNRPTYKLVRGNWQSSNPQKNEYSYNGANTTGAGQSIQSVKYYLYKSKNPLFSPTSKYNTTNRLERFYFYRFTGKALGMVDTDNYLIAIDKYSKLVFAFAVPVEWKQYISGTPKAPIKWGSVELGWESDYNTGNQASFKVSGASYFYEYDPVGIVKPNGEIEIYDWCLNSIGNNKRYGPRIEGNNARDTSRAIATYGKPGRSPYIPIRTNGIITNGGGDNNNQEWESTKEQITITAKGIRNLNSISFEGWGYIGSIKTMYPPYRYDAKDWAFLAYGVEATVYDSDIPTELVILEDLYKNGVGIKTLGRNVDKLKVKVNQTKYFSEGKSYKLDVEDIKEKEIYIELASTVFKYNLLLDYIDTDNFGKNGSRDISRSSGYKVKLVYDSNTDSFVIKDKGPKKYTSTQYYGSYSKEVEISYDNNFTLKRGEKKDFVLRYFYVGEYYQIEVIDVIYTLEFKSAS